jgi:hypothetical protein
MIDNIDWLIELMGDLDRELAIDPPPALRTAMGHLVEAVWEDFGLITDATVNPVWKEPAANVLELGL